MGRIPKDIIESGKLDGCGMWQEMIHIILPLCWPTFSMLLLLNIASIFTASGPILLLTQGLSGTKTISYWIFERVYGSSTSLYMPSALGLACTAVLLPIVLLSRWGLGKVYADVEF